MDVFSAFPNAIISGLWEIGEMQRSTEVGMYYKKLNYIDVIIAEESLGGENQSPNADAISFGSLLYVRPSEMPTVNSSALIAGYLVKDGDTGQYYQITSVGIGKNQENGSIEHIELGIEPTEIVENE